MPRMDAIEGAWLYDHGAATTKVTQFQTTLWTTVQAAGDQSSPDADAALSRLCQIYWRPVYAFIRTRTPSPEQAQDLTQSFFSRFLEKNCIACAERERGRFRSFLMTSVRNFLCDEHDRASSLKRGGGQGPLSLDAFLAEEENQLAEAATPASAFEKRWARTLLDQVMNRLAGEYQKGKRLSLFDCLLPHLWGDGDCVPYEELSKRLCMTAVHLRVSAHRMRQRYREILREEIGQTVASPSDIDSEIQYLLHVVSME